MLEKQIHIQDLSLTTFQWLTACGNKANKNFIKDELTIHPDYPALTSVVDMLDAGGMDYLAVRTSMEHAHEFKYPLLAHIKKGTDEQGLVTVNNEKEWKADNDLSNHWTGVLLMPEKNAVWKHADNDAYIKAERNKKHLSIAALVTILAITLATITQQTAIATILFTLLSTAGLIIALLTFTTELGMQNQLVKQVCNSINPAGGCGRVLKSKQANGIIGISPADAALAWFTIQWLFIIIGTWVAGLYTLVNTAMLVSLAGIIAAAWSIISQKFIVKQWCALCLGLAAVLIIEFTIGIAYLPDTTNINAILAFLIAMPLLIFLIINPLKQLIKQSQSQKPLQRELKKWKQDTNTFIALWQQQPLVDCSPWPYEFQLGNPDAAVQITVACNPYCGPCAIAHKKLDRLLEKYHNKLGVRIRFSINAETPEDKRTEVVKLLLQNQQKNSNASKALSEWFENMNLEIWKDKYHPNETIDVQQQLVQHDEWAKEAGIAYTPTIFINGRQLPGQYVIDDMDFQILKVVEILQPNQEMVA